MKLVVQRLNFLFVECTTVCSLHFILKGYVINQCWLFCVFRNISIVYMLTCLQALVHRTLQWRAILLVVLNSISLTTLSVEFEWLILLPLLPSCSLGKTFLVLWTRSQVALACRETSWRTYAYGWRVTTPGCQHRRISLESTWKLFPKLTKSLVHAKPSVSSPNLSFPFYSPLYYFLLLFYYWFDWSTLLLWLVGINLT